MQNQFRFRSPAGSSLAVLVLLASLPGLECARAADTSSVYVPTHVSKELQNVIRSKAAARPGAPYVTPKDTTEWKAYITTTQDPKKLTEYAHALLKRFPSKFERSEMAGVAVHVFTPPDIPVAHRNRVLMHLHGGSYYGGAGINGVSEAILMAHYTRTKVISVDYRVPPDNPFPAALDDSVAVWKEILRTVKPANAAIGGTSAGGGLTLATVMKLRELHVPLPAAIFVGTPWADLTNQGDTSVRARLARPTIDDAGADAARLYAGGHDLHDPFISPLYGSFTQFPPAVLISGTRDGLLSDTVRVHRKLRRAGIEADLHVFEALDHAEYMLHSEMPESAEAFGEIAQFFDRHLGD